MADNYKKMRDQMELRFLQYEQEEMLRKFPLKQDEGYLYLTFIGRQYRINRRTGRVEGSDDGFSTCAHAGYNEAMTIFDVLCCSASDCALSGDFVPVSRLPGLVQSSSIGSGIFQKEAFAFEHRLSALQRACEALGGTREPVGDVSYRLPLFPVFPVILQYWDSDEEFPPSLKLMWDLHTLQYMHYETTYFAAGHLMKRLLELMG